MAWRKVDLNVDGNLRCDISDKEIYAAVHGLRKQLQEAGFIKPKNSASKIHHQNGTIGIKSIPGRAVASKVSSGRRAAVRPAKAALATRKK
jgi:hypothetical protein